MRKMKNSGIVWIGEIPEGWGIVLLSSIFKQRKEKNINNKENNLLSLSYGKIIRKDISISDGLLPQSYETYNIINNGDIVFRLTDLQNDKRSLRTGLCKEKGIITSAYVTIKPTVELISEYMQYLYHSYDICKVFYGMGDGVRQGMNYDDLRRLPTLFPEYEEQQKIADFLDKKCAEIDKLIELQESMIEKLKEYKQSVITQAVTKGLDPDVPMKDSGIEWIGKIPEGWRIAETKSIFNIYTGATPKSDYEEFWDGDINWITPADYKTQDVFVSCGKRKISEKGLNSCSTYLIPAGGLIFSKRAPIGSVAIAQNELCTNQGCLSCVAKLKIEIKYYYYLISTLTAIYELFGAGTTFKEISTNAFSSFKLVLPDFIEQQQIADYLDKKCAEIDDLIKLKEQKIEKLKEYKKSLIYEYVTGKKEVV